MHVLLLAAMFKEQRCIRSAGHSHGCACQQNAMGYTYLTYATDSEQASHNSCSFDMVLYDVM